MQNQHLKDAFRSMEWADSNINKLKRRIEALQTSKPYSLRFYNKPDLTKNGLCFKWESPIPDDFDREIRNIVQDIRSPLDYIINAVAFDKGIDITKQRYTFPISKDAKALEDGMKKGRIEGIDKNLPDIIRAIQPYDRGNNADLIILRDLNDSEKHRKLSAIGGFQSRASFGIKYAPGSMHIKRIGNQRLYDGLEFLTYSANQPLDANFEFTFHIVFSEIPAVEGQPAILVLKQVLRSVQGVVKIITDHYFP